MPPAQTSVWTRRPAPDRRRGSLTREAITTAAVGVADAEGVDAVTIRRVAGELSARPMSLYSHIDRKDDLIDLMLDAVSGEGLLTTVPQQWREALSAIAHATRALALAHPWLIDAITRRSFIGPNGLLHAEQSLAAVAGLDIDIDRKREILRAVDTYTIGNVTVELSEVNTRRRLKLSAQSWRRSSRDHVSELIRDGDYPLLREIGPRVYAGDADPGAVFEAGLGWLLDGIAASL